MNYRASFLMRFILLIVLSGIFLSACGDKTSPEDQVRQFLAAMTQAAEARDVLAVRDLIADGYADAEGRDKRSVVGVATGYFLRNKNIHLFTQIDEIRFPDANESQVKMFVAMTGSPVTSAEGLLNLRADLYQFDLTLIRDDDDWLLKKANWKRVAIDEMLGD